MKRQSGWVLAVEDDENFMQFIQRQISPVPSRAAYNLHQAKDRVAEEVPDAVVLDLGLPDGLGLDLVPWLRERAPQLPVLILTGHLDAVLINRAQILGCEYALKDAGSVENIQAFVRRALGVSVATVELLARSHGLTGREREILVLSARGLRRSEVAARLGISPDTVKTHTARLLSKVGAKSMHALLASITQQN